MDEFKASGSLLMVLFCVICAHCQHLLDLHWLHCRLTETADRRFPLLQIAVLCVGQGWPWRESVAQMWTFGTW